MCPPFESNTLELSNTILCHATGLSFLIQPVIVALIRNPLPELGVGSVLLWDEAVAELDLEFAQLLKSYAPNGCQLSLACSPVKANTIECSNVLSCHRSCLCFFVFLPLLMTLSLGVGRIPSWHKIVTKLNIAFPPALWSCWLYKTCAMFSLLQRPLAATRGKALKKVKPLLFLQHCGHAVDCTKLVRCSRLFERLHMLWLKLLILILWHYNLFEPQGLFQHCVVEFPQWANHWKLLARQKTKLPARNSQNSDLR